ncbi:hypothetical protein CXG81DRAFT_26166 [Caulochytrium protostelioides]|uniref:Glucosidase 2 subunit beta n=1 Tax=Caulochytrium protostelioides TaxID=1555241 RepID=A0A4P9X848_9FUNG|nr:hypothetical protein CXG81DRAFT_26166 [Caulochytrium protostelioides]|eukprot:RKP01151.1 hypothetical protein CXG81DRAFT_26166 [Caulochytrium protostelioides]
MAAATSQTPAAAPALSGRPCPVPLRCPRRPTPSARRLLAVLLISLVLPLLASPSWTGAPLSATAATAATPAAVASPSHADAVADPVAAAVAQAAGADESRGRHGLTTSGPTAAAAASSTAAAAASSTVSAASAAASSAAAVTAAAAKAALADAWQANALRGVHPSLVAHYTFEMASNQTAAEHVFTCLDKSRQLPASAINDGYCDCPDGSDEVGTSACSHLTVVTHDRATGAFPIGPFSKPRFWCANEGHVGQSIPSSAVNDGICDAACCDGSDEWASGTACPSTCAAQAAAARRRAAEEAAVRAAGQATRAAYVADHAALAEKRRRERHDLLATLAASSARVAFLNQTVQQAELLETQLERRRQRRLAEEQLAACPTRLERTLGVLDHRKARVAALEKRLDEVYATLKVLKRIPPPSAAPGGSDDAASGSGDHDHAHVAYAMHPEHTDAVQALDARFADWDEEDDAYAKEQKRVDRKLNEPILPPLVRTPRPTGATCADVPLATAVLADAVAAMATARDAATTPDDDDEDEDDEDVEDAADTAASAAPAGERNADADALADDVDDDHVIDWYLDHPCDDPYSPLARCLEHSWNRAAALVRVAASGLWSWSGPRKVAQSTARTLQSGGRAVLSAVGLAAPVAMPMAPGGASGTSSDGGVMAAWGADEAEAARALRRKPQKARQIFAAAERELAAARAALHAMDEADGMDFGPDGAWEALFRQCFAFDGADATYEFCPLDRVTRLSQGGGDATLLGRFVRWGGRKPQRPDRPHEYAMQYYEGGRCPDGGVRSAEVAIECGATNAITRVSEPSKWRFSLRFRTPAACSSAS